MVEARALHREAMRLLAEADFAQTQGEKVKAERLLAESLELEIEAAEFYKDKHDIEPTRSQLYKGAARIALRLQDNRRAEQLVSNALIGNPPGYNLEDLRNLLEDIHFNRHILDQGIRLSSNEIDLTLTGDGVGYGVVEKEEVFRRIDALQNIFVRNAERKRQQAFRRAGRPTSEVSKEVQLFLAAPRAASFGVKIRLGSEQSELPLEESSSVLHQTMQALQALQSGYDEDLKEIIPEESYLRNFVSTARELLPDGRKVRAVHLSTDENEKRSTISLTRQRRDTVVDQAKSAGAPPTIGSVVSIVGEIRAMDSLEENEFVTLLSETGSQKLYVPGEQMDALTLYYKVPVEVSARFERRRLTFVDIKRIENAV